FSTQGSRSETESCRAAMPFLEPFIRQEASHYARCGQSPGRGQPISGAPGRWNGISTAPANFLGAAVRSSDGSIWHSLGDRLWKKSVTKEVVLLFCLHSC